MNWLSKSGLALAAAFLMFGCGTGGGGGDDVPENPDVVADNSRFPDLVADGQGEPDTPVTDLVAEDQAPPVPDGGGDLPVPEEILEDQVNDQVSPQVTLDLAGPDGWQRGPVSLYWTLMLEHEPTAVEVRFDYSVEGSAFAPCTVLAGFGDPLATSAGETCRYVWDAMADVPADANMVVVRVTASVAGEDVAVALTHPFSLRNDPARKRTAFITSSINGNNKVRRLEYESGVGFSYDGNITEVSAGPVAVIFTPNGKAALTVEQDGHQLTFFAVAEEGTATVAQTVDCGGNYFEEGVVSDDGSTLYLVDFNSTPEAGIYVLALDPWTGLPVDGTLTQLSYARVAGGIALLPENRGYAVVAGAGEGADGDIILELRTPAGEMLNQIAFAPDGSMARAVAINAYGDSILAAYANLFGEGEEVVSFMLDEDFGLEQMGAVEVVDPETVLFASDGMRAIVTEAWENRVSLVTIGGGIALSKLGSVKVDLAINVASPTWGPDRDRFFVTTVSASTGESGVALLFVDDMELVHEGFFSLGNGTDVIPAGVAIQP